MKEILKNDVMEIQYDVMNLRHIVVIKVPDLWRAANKKEEVIKSVVSEFEYNLRKILNDI